MFKVREQRNVLKSLSIPAQKGHFSLKISQEIFQQGLDKK